MDDHRTEARGTLSIVLVVVVLIAFGIAIRSEALAWRPFLVLGGTAIATAIVVWRRRAQVPTARIVRR